jgi:hypothetical protein
MHANEAWGQSLTVYSENFLIQSFDDFWFYDLALALGAAGVEVYEHFAV